MKISPSVYSRAFGAETVLLEFSRGEYFSLDEVGSEVFRRLENGDAPSVIADALASIYDVEREVALTDVTALIEQLRREGLVL